MSAFINEATLMGNLGQDPVLRYLPNNDAVLNISIATNEKFTDRQTGEIRESTEWHRVSLYKNHAEIVAKYMKKGDKIWVRGKLKSNNYTDRNGVSRSSYEVIVRDMLMIKNRDRAEADNDTADNADNGLPEEAAAPQNSAIEEDLPF